MIWSEQRDFFYQKVSPFKRKQLQIKNLFNMPTICLGKILQFYQVNTPLLWVSTIFQYDINSSSCSPKWSLTIIPPLLSLCDILALKSQGIICSILSLFQTKSPLLSKFHLIPIKHGSICIAEFKNFNIYIY